MLALRKIIFVVLFTLVFTAAPILVLEAVLRVLAPQPLGPPQFSYDSQLGAVPVPGQVAYRTLSEDPPYTTTNGADGLRQTGLPRLDVGLRILMLGDSFTYGTGVNDENTFSAQLEAKLRDAAVNATVFNAGNPGTGTDYALKFLQTKGSEIKPTHVVLNFYPNDYADNESWKFYELSADEKLYPQDINKAFGFYKSKAWLNQSRLYGWLCSRLHTLSLLRRASAWLKISGALGQWSRFIHARPDEELLAKGMANATTVKTFELLLTELNRQCQALGAKLIVAYIPSHYDVATTVATGGPSKDEAAFMSVAEKLKVPLVRYTDTFISEHYEKNKFYLNDGHWSPHAHSLAAQTLLKIFKTK